MNRYLIAALGALVICGAFVAAVILAGGGGQTARIPERSASPGEPSGAEVPARPPPGDRPPDPRPIGPEDPSAPQEPGGSAEGPEETGGSFPISPGTASVIFEIVDGGDRPLRGAKVDLLAGRQRASRVTGADGLAAFGDIRDGVYTYRIECSGVPPLVSARELILSPREERRVPLSIGPHDLVIAGSIRDAEGNPLPGIPVHGREQIYDGDEDLLLRADRGMLGAETDALGRYSIGGLTETDYVVSVERVPGFASVNKIFRAGTQSADIVLVALRRIAVVGTVSSRDGAPLPDVLVVPTGQSSRQATTEAGGSFRLELDLDEEQVVHVLTATKEGFRQARLNLRSDQFGDADTWETEIVLDPLGARAPVRGTVLDSEGDPVPGETVYLQSPTLNARYQATTAADGTFAMDEVQAGTDYRLLVYPRRPFKDAWLQDSTRMPVVVPEEGIELEIVLARIATGALQGVMVDPEGTPIPRYTLWIRSMKALGNSLSITGDASGTFRAEGIPEGEMVLETRSAPHISLRGLRLAPGDDRDVTLVLDWGTHALDGSVLGGGGQPLQGARTSLRWSQERDGILSTSSRNALSDAAGRFSFTELGAGEHRLIVSSPGHVQVQISVNVGAGEPSPTIRLQPLDGPR